MFRFNIDKAAQLRYEELPTLQQRYRDMEKQLSDGYEMDVDGEKSVSSLVKVADHVGESQVAAVISRWTGVPVDRLTRENADRLLGLGQRISSRVLNQPRAVQAVTEAVIRSRAGLADESRPW